MNKISKSAIITVVSVFLCTLCFGSVKAKPILGSGLSIETRDSFQLELSDVNRQESFGYFRNEESDNGKHLGFTTSHLKYEGPRIEIAGYMPPTIQTTGAIPNPEPTTMILFGTGVMGLAGYARRMRKRNR